MKKLEDTPTPRRSSASSLQRSSRRRPQPNAGFRTTTAESKQTKSLPGVASYIVALGQTDPVEQAVWKRALAGRSPYTARGISVASYVAALTQTDPIEQARWMDALGARPRRRQSPGTGTRERP